MKPTRLFAFLIALAVVAALGSVRLLFPARQPSPPPPPSSIAATIIESDGPDRTVTHYREPAEIFRRAFWRQPTATDHIVRADRREWSPAAAAHDVQRWQWFLQLQPGPVLLAALRDPATFGLQPAHAPALAVDPDPPPAWFPTPAQLAGYEILQAPDGGLTLFYRPSDNTLFATDSGAGFSSAVAVR